MARNLARSGAPRRSRRGDQTYLSLGQRFVTLAVYLLLLYAFHVAMTGHWEVSLSDSGLWLVSAIGFLSYSLLDTPFFVPPREALATALGAGLVLLAIDLPDSPSLTPVLQTVRWSAVGAALLTVAAAAAAIVLHSSEERSNWSKTAYFVATALGDGRLLFTPPALISIVGYHQDSLADILWLMFGWTVLVLVRPVELVWSTVRNFRAGVQATASAAVGTIDRIDSPNIVRVALHDGGSWERKATHVACLPDGSQVHVVPLSKQTRGDGFLGSGLIHGAADPELPNAVPGSVYRPSTPLDGRTLLAQLAGSAEGCALVGFVVEESRIAGVRFEVATEVNLEKGTLVFCRQGEVKVFYQILDATTTEESFEKNPFGSHRASAVQLGVLDSEEGFVKYPWLPAMNCPVFLARDLQALKAELDDDQLVLGTVPGTRLEVRARFSDLLEYHTAVLGVTGTGKTEFVYDIIRHGLRTGAKIFCVDFTAEYRERLSDLVPELLGFDAAAMDELEALILGVETGDFAAGREKEALEDWVRASRPGTEGRVDGFLRAEGPGLGIFELPEIANTRATLRATELYLSAIFNWARKHRRARPILVVLEEAHTVIPEMTLFQRDRADSYAVVGRMSQIALQGRKFGVGLLLISQRTALVSKTLLSQCNTCFSFAMYDKTGLEYLSTIYGKEHVEAVPNLSFLQCIGFGKAVLSDRPILFKLPYEQAKKEASEALRRAVSPDEILEEAPSQPDEEPRNQTLPSPDDDDIPF